MSTHMMSRAAVVLACAAGLALLSWSYVDLGSVWLLQALPWCS